jgi:putative nucleotidyltransferase with HDIG domain
VDLAVEGDPRRMARRLADKLGGAAFALSEEFGAWRFVAKSRGFVCDISPLQAETIEADLSQRDFTINAMAVSLFGGELIDPFGGLADLDARTLRVTQTNAYDKDFLRPLRLVRFIAELSFDPDGTTQDLTEKAASKVALASSERVFSELRRLVTADGVLDALEVSERLGVLEAVLPEVAGLRGVAQSFYHHLDVYQHTIEVLRQQLILENSLADTFPNSAEAVEKILDQPLSQDLTRGQALRFAALLHDVGKPATRRVRADGRVMFLGHDQVGAELVRDIGSRLKMSQRLCRYLQDLTLHHLVVGFLVHERPLSARTVYQYLTRCEPVEVELILLTCADRLATRGRKADKAIANHLELARELLDDALAWRLKGPPNPVVRGDELARSLGIAKGPKLGELMAKISEATYAGEVVSKDDALALAADILRRS